MNIGLKKILLICTAGISTSILVNRINIVIKEMDINIEVASLAICESNKIPKEIDLILLGPQVAFKSEEIKAVVNNEIPIEIIETKDYGIMDGKAILLKALQKLNNSTNN